MPYNSARHQSKSCLAVKFSLIVRPEVVVEVAYKETRSSPRYASEAAHHFARIMRFWEPKSPES